MSDAKTPDGLDFVLPPFSTPDLNLLGTLLSIVSCFSPTLYTSFQSVATLSFLPILNLKWDAPLRRLSATARLSHTSRFYPASNFLTSPSPLSVWIFYALGIVLEGILEFCDHGQVVSSTGLPWPPQNGPRGLPRGSAQSPRPFDPA